jgi:hypothetical protein
LVEPLYISSQTQAALLLDPSVRQEQGNAIAAGIKRFLTTSEQGRGYQPQSLDGDHNPGGGGGDGGCVDPKL